MKKHFREIGEKFKSLDTLGEGINFKIDGQRTHKTYLGSIVTLLIAYISLNYLMRHFGIMLSYADTTHQQTEENFIPARDQAFTYDETDFNVMMGLFTRVWDGSVVGFKPLDSGYFDLNFR